MICADTFFINNVKSEVQLFEDRLFVKGTLEQTFWLKDIVGFSSVGVTVSVHHYQVQTAGCCSGTTRAYQPLQLQAEDSAEETGESLASQWALRGTQLLCGTPLTDQVPAKRKLLVFINPQSGSRTAEKIWRKCAAVLDRAHVETNVLVTAGPGHAQEEAKQAKMNEVDAFIVISGDGLVHEVVNGIMSRKDWQKAVDHFAIGHIPAGSGNGLSKSVTNVSGEAADAVSASFIIAKGKTRKLDMFACSQDGHPTRFGFLSLSWAIISEIDIKSEQCRWCGPARFTFAGLLAICCRPQYGAQLSFLPGPNVKLQQKPEKARRALPALPGCTLSAECNSCSTENEKEKLQAFIDQSGAEEKEEGNWESVEDRFTMLWAMNTPWAASDMFVAPRCHLSDGLMDLTFIRDISRCRLLEAFLTIEKGEHEDLSAFEYVKAKAVRLMPNNEDCVIAIDGEALPSKGPTEVRMFQSILNVICA